MREWMDPVVVSAPVDYNWNPRLSRLADGNIALVWTESDLVGDRLFPRLAARILDPSGQPAGPILTVPVPAGYDSFSDAAIVARADGGCVIAYSVRSTVGPRFDKHTYDTEILQVHDRTGALVERHVMASLARQQLLITGLIAQPDGDMFLALRNMRDDAAFVMGFDAATGMVTRRHVLTGPGSFFSETTAATDLDALPGGRGYVAVSSYTIRSLFGGEEDLALRFLRPNGQVTARIELDVAFLDMGNSQCPPVVAALGPDRIVVGWAVDAQGAVASALHAQMFDRTGAATSPVFVIDAVAASYQTHLTLRDLGGGRFAAFWIDAGTETICARLFDDAGLPVTVRTEIIQRQLAWPATFDVDVLDDGRIAITWARFVEHPVTHEGADTVEFTIWDPRSAPGAPDSLGRLYGTPLGDRVTLPDGITLFDGGRGADRVVIGPGIRDDPGVLRGGAGADQLILSADAGPADLTGCALSGFEVIRLAAAPAGAAQDLVLTASQAVGLARIILDGDGGAPDRVTIVMGAARELDLAQMGVIGLTPQDRLQITGDASAERITGSRGADMIRAQGGRDRLDGGAGADLLDGGAGADAFVFGAGSGADRVVLFQNGADRVDLQGLAFADLSLSDLAGGGVRVAVTAQPTSFVDLMGVSTAQVDAGDFI